ncbi:MAG: DEAD/DEAH box helicase [Methanosarcinaceae archaeon]|nr:DEAD/DEAH box helicase [Methanosarcinaceae archaeon]
MTLWTLVSAERSKIIVLPIRDKKKSPLFIGELILRKTSTGPRPLRFRVIRDKKEEYRPPEELIELLRLSSRIMIASGGDSRLESEFLEMLRGFQLEADHVNICRFCLLKRRFNFVNKKSIKYHRELICEECAKEELSRALLNARTTYGVEAMEHIEQLLLKSKDLDRTIGMLSPHELDTELTRFDSIEARPPVPELKIKDLPISKKFKNILLEKSDELLPVQSLSVEKGLLKRKNQLVTSVTATGKTLIGELAGIENILKGKGKMLYLVPLVALANQKYDQFTQRYSNIGIKTSIRIGSSRIRTSKTASMRTTLDSDIIVGTYEGLDYILRTSGADLLGMIGTVVIDEVHMLEDSERGHRLDGLIGRLKYVASDAQFIYLSATVAKPELLAQKLVADLIEYEYRPVPIERHLVFCQEHDKNKLITKLIKEEYDMVSSKGHRGQTIIFTNSRRNCHSISEGIPMPSAPYHAGLTHQERKKVENRFLKGQLPVVVTTAALAAGVDFPASQIIFESLAMGINWLSMQEFLQMLGRAGRPDYHDRGRVVLLAVPNKKYTSDQTGSEDEIAVRLLKGHMLHTDIEYGEEEQMEEILASAAVTSSRKDIETIHGTMLGNFALDELLARLKKNKFLQQKGDRIALTRFGSIAAGHFLSISKAFMIRDAVLSNHEPIDIVTNLEFFDAAYFKYAPQISKILKVNMPSRVFQGGSIDILFEGENISKLDVQLQDQIFGFAEEFLTCRCKDMPYCGCPERKFSAKIITLRTEGHEPARIVKRLEDMYGITAYPGDVFGYLDNVVRNLEAVGMIANAYSKKDNAYRARQLRKLVEG